MKLLWLILILLVAGLGGAEGPEPDEKLLILSRLTELQAEKQVVEVKIAEVSALDAKVFGPAEAKRLRDKALKRPDAPPVKAGNITMRQHLLRLSERWEREPQKILDERRAALETALASIEAKILEASR